MFIHEIRPMRREDAQALLEIENIIWTNENSPVVRHLDDPEAYWTRVADNPTFVAVADGEVVGFINYAPPTPLESHRFLWEIAMGVHPAWQGMGIGGQLINAVKQLARDQQIHKIMLRVLESNAGAIRFYERQGFVREGYFRDEFFIDGAFRGDCQYAFFLE